MKTPVSAALVIAILFLLSACNSPSQAPQAAPQPAEPSPGAEQNPASPPAPAAAPAESAPRAPAAAAQPFEAVTQAETELVLRCRGVSEEACKEECFTRFGATSSGDPCYAMGKVMKYTYKEISIAGETAGECRAYC